MPQTVPAWSASLDVRVTLALSPGDALATNVKPSMPVVTFSPDGGGTPILETTPHCVMTPASSVCAPVPLEGVELRAGDELVYTFTYNKVPGAIGPVWFSVSASGVIPGIPPKPVVSATVQTYALAIDSERPFNAPTVTASLSNEANGPSPNGWFRTQPVLVDLAAALAEPGDDRDGAIQQIEYHFGPVAPFEGGYYVCFNRHTAVDPDAASCSIPVYKEGLTRIWYRALSTRGRYNRLVPHALEPSVLVPGWTSIDVRLDVTPPSIEIWPTDANNVRLTAVNGWLNRVPAQLKYVASDTGSLLDSVEPSSGVPGVAWSATSALHAGFSQGTFLFGESGLFSVGVTATDRAGNGTQISEEVKIDAVAPRIVAQRARSATAIVWLAGTQWSRSLITVGFDAFDDLSGFDEDGTLTFECPTFEVEDGPPQEATCTAQDQAGNVTTVSAGFFGVDTTPPTIDQPDLTVEALGAQTLVRFSPRAVDAADPSPSLSCTPASSTLFALGATVVRCRAVDALGNVGTGTFTVSVADRTPPVVTAPSTLNVVTSLPRTVLFDASALDAVDGSVPVHCTPGSGSLFAVGTTPVVCRASDRAGNSATASFAVSLGASIVRTAPLCTDAVATLASIWPPNHQLVSIGIGGVTNADGGAITYRITSIFQDEPTNSRGDGATAFDGFGVGTSHAQVRAERSGRSNGRVYYISYAATSAGGSCSGRVTVGVPRDQGHGPAIGDGPSYDSTIAWPQVRDDHEDRSCRDRHHEHDRGDHDRPRDDRDHKDPSHRHGKNHTDGKHHDNKGKNGQNTKGGNGSRDSHDARSCKDRSHKHERR